MPEYDGPAFVPLKPRRDDPDGPMLPVVAEYSRKPRCVDDMRPEDVHAKLIARGNDGVGIIPASLELVAVDIEAEVDGEPHGGLTEARWKQAAADAAADFGPALVASQRTARGAHLLLRAGEGFRRDVVTAQTGFRWRNLVVDVIHAHPYIRVHDPTLYERIESRIVAAAAPIEPEKLFAPIEDPRPR